MLAFNNRTHLQISFNIPGNHITGHNLQLHNLPLSHSRDFEVPTCAIYTAT